jgi:methionyl-tRNA synthetase
VGEAGLRYDHFIRTTDAYHVAFVRKILAEIHGRGDIYFGSYTGLYCYGCERFYQERELVNGLCPDHKVAPTEIAEENYFFRMGAYQDRLRETLETRPELITPDGTAGRSWRSSRADRRPLHLAAEDAPGLGHRAAVRRPLRHVRLVRRAPQLRLGARARGPPRPLALHRAPDRQGHPEAARRVLADDAHGRGAAALPPPVRARPLAGERREDVEEPRQRRPPARRRRALRHGRVRYYLLREMAFGQDAEFSEDALVTRLNADLANGLGNLASRVLAMQQRYFAGAVQPLPAAPEPVDLALREAFATARREFDAHVAELGFHRGLEALWRALDHANKYVVETAPFKLAKDKAALPRVGAILHELCEALRVTAQLVAPVLPETAVRLVRLLGLPDAAVDRLDLPWGGAFGAGHATLPPETLFPRIEERAE